MSRLHRLALHLCRRALQGYEILLCAVLLALALSIATPAQEAEAEAAHCGNIQSSTVVMER